MTLLAVPNVSEGRDRAALRAIASAFAGQRAKLLDTHADGDHNRSVFTLAGEPGDLAPAVLAGARAALERIDLGVHAGQHPRIGALDVAPVVYLEQSVRGAACAEALVLADLLGAELGLPVFLYGVLADGRTRAELRRGGVQALNTRLDKGELRPDFGPPALRASAGATMVAARPPLVAFNLELAAPATLQEARAIAARIREGGAEGLPGLKAIGLWLERRGVAQVSTNIEDHRTTPLAAVVAAVRRHASLAGCELVGLAPSAALDGFPTEIPFRNKRTIEEALSS